LEGRDRIHFVSLPIYSGLRRTAECPIVQGDWMNETRSLAGRRILVVEDDYYLASDTSEWLQREGAEVIGPFSSTDEACQAVEQQAVDVAVIDINLGQGPTFHLASRLAAIDVPFIFATGYDAVALPDGFRDRPRLEKPFTGAQLVCAVIQLG
jgi:CheY-like chemotaxis protein